MTHYANSEAILKISTGFEEDPDIYIYENALRDKTSQRIILDLSGITNLRGKHNHQNIEFAYAICKKLGLASREISKHIQSFVPLPHRMSPVRKINNILFVNDSKATNPSSAAKALASFSGYNIYWLVGGRSKKTDVLSYIKNHLAEVQRIYLFGEDSQEFEKIFNGIKSTVKCNTLSSAINIAYKDATKETGAVVILLSPMCASFDQFQNFEERGNEFVKMVSNLE
jgi:UDP-N-acetylmuramoylalanine--D-glutamate ligase